jgi:hypothetical protein
MLATTTGLSLGRSVTTPDASAVLDLQGATGGLLIPRMTTTQRDALTVASQQPTLIYNTTTLDFEWFSAAAGGWVALDAPVTRAQFAASATISGGGGTVQYVPRWKATIASATVTSVPATPLEGAPYRLSILAYNYIGNAGNAGQTFSLELQVNGVLVAGSNTGALDATASASGVFVFPAQSFGAGGNRIQAVVRGANALTNPLGLIEMAAGG